MTLKRIVYKKVHIGKKTTQNIRVTAEVRETA
jgi:hypothetical protein